MAAKKQRKAKRREPRAGLVTLASRETIRGVDLTRVLAGYTPGHWVALNKAMTKVLLSSPDPAELVNLVEEKGLHDDVVLMWVPDPGVHSVY